MTPVVGIGPGTWLDDFLLRRLLGRGAMAEVYLAEQRSLSRSVAVKILSPAWATNAEQVTRFHREVRTLALLQHPNIVTAFYAGHAHDVHYLAMHFVQGGTLQDRLRSSGPLSEAEALSVVYKVADALQFAWERHGLIHRDVKPANIMIDADGEVKLTDLGISKCVYETGSITHGHRIFGTPHYMSPEQARGELNLDFRSDQYSLGATLYHLLAGSPPFETSDVNEIIRRQKNENPTPIHLRRSGISKACASCLARMMAKQREQRYQSWGELLHVVGNILSESPTQNILVEDATMTSSPPRSRPSRLPVLLLLLAMAIGAAWWLHKERGLTIKDIQRVPQEMQRAGAKVREQYILMDGAVLAFQAHLAEHREQKRRVQEVMTELDRQVDRLVGEGQREQAVALYLNYAGPLAKESEIERQERIAALNQIGDGH